MSDVPIANPVVSDAAKEAVAEVLDSGMLASGATVERFESAFADYVGVDHAIATSSGTTALQAMLEAAGIGPDDTVVTTPFSFISTANAVKHAGASVVFADIDPETYNLDPAAVRSLLAERPDVSALMPVHLYGLPADMDEFESIADEYDLRLFEDAAQAHGATYDGEAVGSLADAGVFSFYPTKNMTTGEGGMITTDDEEVAERARRLIDHGREGRYEHATVGYNYRMTNIQAAIGIDQLERLPSWVEARQTNAAALTARLSRDSGVETPSVPADRTHAYHQYTVRTDRRRVLTDHLDEAGIGYGTYYPEPIPTQPAYDRSTTFPVAERASETVLSLPVHPTVSEDDIDRIVEAVKGGIGA